MFTIRRVDPANVGHHSRSIRCLDSHLSVFTVLHDDYTFTTYWVDFATLIHKGRSGSVGTGSCQSRAGAVGGGHGGVCGASLRL